MIVNRVISGYAYNIIKRILPKISETEKAALNSGSVSIEGDIFAGRVDISSIVSKYNISLRGDELSFLNNETNKLCDMIDNHEIEKRQNLSPETWEYIKRNNFMGLVIPKQFNGKGFSPHAHSLIVEKIAGRNIATAVSVMVPNSLGPGELLYHYGTEEQKNYYLPKLADGTHIPCFGLTTETSGSDAAAMNDTGIVVEENGILGIRMTFSKRYITLAPVASLIGLAFKLSDPNKLLTKGKEGITVVLLEKEKYEGIDIGNRHNPLNIGFMNGTIRGENIFAPMSCVIGGEERCGMGWKMLMESLGEGRGISLPAMSVATAKLCTFGVGGYARIRKQFNIPIAEMEGIKEKLAIIAGINYKMIAAQSLFNAILANNEKPPVISAIMKYKFTEYGRIAVNNGMDILGGAGICKGSMNFLASSYVATPVAITVEGSNTLTRSLIIFGQGLNRSHPHLLNIITSIENNDKKAFGEHFNKIIYHTLNNLVKSVYYGIYLKIYRNPSGATQEAISQYHENHLNRQVANFAFAANMGLLMGGKIKTAEYISGRYADILADIYMSYACLWYYKQHKDVKDIDKILNYSLNDYYCNIEKNINGISANFPIKIIGGLLKFITYPLGKQYMPNDDKLTTVISNAITTPTELRKVLTENVYISENEDDRIRQISDGFEICYNVDRLSKKGNYRDDLNMNRANELRAKIIKVDEYRAGETASNAVL